MKSTLLRFITSRFGFDLSVLGLLIGVCFHPLFLDRIFSKLEMFGAKLARRRCLALLVVALAPIILRVAFLVKVPPPVPEVHDEFSYLLAGDTFAHGRLTNPPHPMWVYFDTIHVNQHPTYMSKYPPAQGAVLALGEIIGHPWIGVLISMAVMYATILWMFYGWFPPSWAFFGGVLLIVQFGVFNDWIESYWGGAVAAIGGALVMGALPRIFYHQRPREAVLLGLGVGILANSRPYEGLVMCAPVLVVLAWWLVGPKSPPWRVTLLRVVIPIAGLLAVTSAFICYYNWRGTGNLFLLPYAVNTRVYMREPLFIWQKLKPPIPYMNAQFDEFYNGWALNVWATRAYDGTWRSLAHDGADTLLIFRRFYVPAEFLVTLVLTLPWVIRDRRTRLLFSLVVICLVGSCVTAYFLPHYVAVLTATCLAIVVQAMRHLRRWHWGTREVGIAFIRVIVSVMALLLFVHAAKTVRSFPRQIQEAKIQWRAVFDRQLEKTPGQHLVIVRYSLNHNPAWEWVYNEANIDHAKVVWAREIPQMEVRPLLDYFHGRQVWLAEPDAIPPRITPYAESAPP